MNTKRSDDSDATILLELLKHRYGSRLDADQLDDLRQVLVGVAEAGKLMRAVRLENSDEPNSIFVPYLGEE